MRGGRRSLSIVVAAALVVLLGSLGTLQYRWIGELSRAERHRLEVALRSSAGRLADDFDREITRAFLHFFSPGGRADAERRLAEAWASWPAATPHPAVVAALCAVRLPRDAPPQLRRLDPASGRFVEAAWSADLEAVRRRLERGSGHRGWHGETLAGAGGELVVAGAAPALLVPQLHSDPAALGVLVLDVGYLVGTLLPELVDRDLAGLEDDVGLRVVAGGGQAPVLYRHGPEVAGAAATGDVTVELLALRPFPELHAMLLDRGWIRHGGPGPRWGRPRHGMIPVPFGEEEAGAWRLVVTHRAGSLERAVATLRRRNLAIGFGILVLLALGGWSLVAGTRRAERLARQQLEFVSGVTHELHTPLAAIRSAAENLADGTVAEPQRVRQYGRLIESEGRRLSELVAEVLELAGIASARNRARREAVAVGTLVEEAVADCAGLLEGSGVRVERDFADDLPQVLGDPQALRRALKNLVENAVKYGGAGGWVGIRAAVDVSEPVVRITVEDRGPGLRRGELGRIFEPFTRGRDAFHSGKTGAGLGLALVRQIAEAHGGTVTAGNRNEGPGAVFTLTLPLARGAAAAAANAVAPRPETA